MSTPHFPLLYHDLKRLAHAELKRHPDRAFNTTALVHESYLKLASAKFESTEHLVSLVTRAMRQVIVDEARARLSQKRGAGAIQITLDPSSSEQSNLLDVIALDQALVQLSTQHPRMAQVLELHSFGGMSAEDIAMHLSVTVRTIQRDLLAARVLVKHGLAGE